MKLTNHLVKSCILLGMQAGTKQEAMSLLVNALCQEHRIGIPKAEIMKALADRDALDSTDMANGISIPHAKFAEFNDIVVAIGVPQTPIGKSPNPIRFIVLILAGKAKTTSYVNLLSAIAQLASIEPLLRQLIVAKTPSAFLELIDASNVSITSGLCVQDIMTENVLSIKPETSLRELMDILYKHKLSYMPVVDHSGVILGEVSLLDIIAKGIPHYASMMANLSFLNTFEAFDELLRNEDKLKASDIMRPVSAKLEPTASVIQAAFELHQKQLRQLLVVKEGRLVGIVSITDIIRKILRY